MDIAHSLPAHLKSLRHLIKGMKVISKMPARDSLKCPANCIKAINGEIVGELESEVEVEEDKGQRE